jgi:hypothetical protein
MDWTPATRTCRSREADVEVGQIAAGLGALLRLAVVPERRELLFFVALPALQAGADGPQLGRPDLRPRTGTDVIIF